MKRHLGGADPEIFYIIHRGGRISAQLLPDKKYNFTRGKVYLEVGSSKVYQSSCAHLPGQ